MTLHELLPQVIGITKKDIALQLDKHNPLFNFSAETGLTSYRHYTRNELLEISLKFSINPVSDYLNKRSSKPFYLKP